MKRIIALLISLLLIILSSVTASAEVDIDELKEDYIAYLDETMDTRHHGLIIIGEAYEENGVLYFFALCGHANFVDEYHKIIGGWYYNSPYTIGPGGIGLFVQSDGKIYDLETAYNTGIITDLNPTLKVLNRSGLKVYPNGDANGDCVLNIRDATAIQKNLAGIETVLIKEDVRQVIMDTDKDGSITVRDATMIQKRIAGLE